MLDGVFCVIFLHGRNSPQSSPTSTPKLTKSLSFEMQPDELIEKPMSPMHYARSGLGTAEMNGKLIAAGKSKGGDFLLETFNQPSSKWTLDTCDMHALEESVYYAFFLGIPLYHTVRQQRNNK